MNRQLNRFVYFLKRVIILVGILFSFFALLEIIRAFDILYDLHPIAGYLFLAVLAALIVYLAYQARVIFKFKKAPVPPDLEQITDTEESVRNYIEFASKVIARFAENHALPSGSEAILERAKVNLKEITDHKHELIQWIEDFENMNFQPLLNPLDKRAEKIVSDNVGIVTVGTALSPYRSLDLYIVLGRNFRMINQIIKIYRTSPSLKETAGIVYDIFKVVAAVNILNSLDNVWAGLGRHIPIVGNYGAAVSEGLFSGLLTSVTGHAAMDRCRTYRRISREKLALQYRNNLKNWAGDIIVILRRHLLDRINPFKKDDEGVIIEEEKFHSFWDKLMIKIKNPLSWKTE